MTPRRTRIWLGLLTLVGFFLRVYRLKRSDFRGDEAFTVQYWMLPTLTESIQRYITLDPQPLLAYAAYNLWGQLVGFSEFAVRMLPALAGTLSVAVMYRFALRATKNRPIALTAAAIWTLHPFLIWHAQDARNYALWSLASVAGLWLALRALERDRPQDWVAYVSIAAVTGYLYYLELFVFVALSAFVLFAFWMQWRVYTKWASAMLTVGAMLAPWYLQPQIRSGGGYGGTTTGFDFGKLHLDFPNALLFGTTTPEAIHGWIWVIVLLVMLLALVAAYRYRPRLALLLALVGFVPPLLLSLVSLRLNVLAPRYVLGAVPAHVLFLALLIANLGRINRTLGAVIAAGWLVVALPTITANYGQLKAPSWTALSDYLNRTVTPNDFVIQTSTDPAFGYYYNVVYRVPADEGALPAQPNQSAAAIHAELERITREYDAVWLAAQGFTDWQSYGIVEAWMDTNMQRVIDTDVAGLRAELYMPPTVRAAEITTDTPLATFGDVAELVDVRVFNTPQPTGELVMLAYWRPLSQTDTPLKGFVHLLGKFNPATGGPVWTQDDHEPLPTPTTNWQVGTLYRDVYTLPGAANVPPGEYTLLIGLYDAQTGQRIPTSEGDAYIITAIDLPGTTSPSMPRVRLSSAPPGQ